jgi:hypothetical protein
MGDSHDPATRRLSGEIGESRWRVLVVYFSFIASFVFIGLAGNCSYLINSTSSYSYPCLPVELRSSQRRKICRPRGLWTVFSRYPALRLRLRAGLSCPASAGLALCQSVPPSQTNSDDFERHRGATLPEGELDYSDSTRHFRHVNLDTSVRRWTGPPGRLPPRFLAWC